MKTLYFSSGLLKLFYNVRSWRVNCFFECEDFLMEWSRRARGKRVCNALRKLGLAFPEQSHKGERRRQPCSDRNKAARWPEGRVAYSFLFRFPDYSSFSPSQGDLATSTFVHRTPASLSLRFSSHALSSWTIVPQNRPALERACPACVVQLRQGRKSVKRSHVLSNSFN